MESKHTKLKGVWLWFALFLMTSVIWQPNPSFACDIAVISGKYTSNGRPVIWKNRDHGPRWEQEIRYYEAVDPSVGGSVRIVDRASISPLLYADGTKSIMSGGVNESGFAITNTTVYENDFIHEYISNANHLLMEFALETCKTVEDFDAVLEDFKHISKDWIFPVPLEGMTSAVISGNFVAIDAEGGAVLYEIYSGAGTGAYLTDLMINRYDANNIEDAPFGFVNRTNSHDWLERNSDTQREVRGTEILTELYEEGIQFPNDESKGLNFKNILMILAKDVCGDDPYMVNGIPVANAVNKNTPNKYNTTYCISRYMTNIAMVVDGVTPGDDPKLTTLWCNLGEPAIGVSTPYFPAAGAVTPYAWAEQGMETSTPVDKKVTCALNQAINDQEIDGLYKNNWDYGNVWIEMDRTIDYELLREVQEWTLPLENQIIEHTETILDQYRNGASYTAKNLYDLSHYAAGYMYNNYTNQSYSDVAWDFGGIYDEGSVPDDDDPVVDPDPDPDPGDTDPPVDPGSNTILFTQFMIWLMSLFAV